jgi:hypothetical protein
MWEESLNRFNNFDCPWKKFAGDFWQVCDFLQIPMFDPSVKITVGNPGLITLRYSLLHISGEYKSFVIYL